MQEYLPLRFCRVVSSPHNRKAATVAWRAWRVCVCVVVRKVRGSAVFMFSSCALTTSTTPIGRALRGVSFLTRASGLRCWVVALDVNASVNAPVIHDFFFTNTRTLWDMRPRLFTEAHPDDLSEHNERSPSR